MNRVRILPATPEYEIISHGNGLAYEVIRSGDFASVFLQGDDATIFRAEIDAADEIGPHAVAYACSAYDSLMKMGNDE